MNITSQSNAGPQLNAIIFFVNVAKDMPHSKTDVSTFKINSQTKLY